MHEAQMHPRNAFVTLTYRPEDLRTNSLVHRDYQLFIKKLRRHVDRTTQTPIRYYMSGEYGTRGRRPHFHACLFGHDFEDKKHWRMMPSGSRLYTSGTLDKIWGHGFTSVGAVTFESAAYIARYLMDKITGPNAWQFYQHTDEQTGEITDLVPEYNKMSQGIGKAWLQKYEMDAYPEGEILIRGHKSKTPKYYDKKFKETNPEEYEAMKMQRELQALEYRDDNTPERLAAKERVAQAKVNLLLRKL